MNLFLSFKKSILVNYAMLHGICIYSAILLKVCSHGKTAKASSTGVMAYLFYIFLITGNFTTNNALKQSFNIMNLRFNFTSNKSLLIIIIILPKWQKSVMQAVTYQNKVAFVLIRHGLRHGYVTDFSHFGKMIIMIRRDLLEVKLNLKIIISKDSFNALFVVKFPVIRKI